MWRKPEIQAIMVLWVVVLGAAPCFGQSHEVSASPDSQEELCERLNKGARIKLRMYEATDPENPDSETSLKTVTGLFQFCRDGQLVFKPENSRSLPDTVHLDNVNWMQVSRGKEGHTMIGGMVGFLTGIAISTAVQTRSHEDEFLGGLSDMEDNVTRGIGITVATTLVGVVIGSAVGTEKWVSVYDSSWTASMERSPQGEYLVAVAYSF